MKVFDSEDALAWLREGKSIRFVVDQFDDLYTEAEIRREMERLLRHGFRREFIGTDGMLHCEQVLQQPRKTSIPHDVIADWDRRCREPRTPIDLILGNPPHSRSALTERERRPPRPGIFAVPPAVRDPSKDGEIAANIRHMRRRANACQTR